MAFCNTCGHDFTTVAPKYCSECGAIQPPATKSQRPSWAPPSPPSIPSAPGLIDDAGYPTETLLNLADAIFDALDSVLPASLGVLPYSKFEHLCQLTGDPCGSEDSWHRMWELYGCETTMVPFYGTTGRPKHLNIYCDECGKGNFEGDRWKCRLCPDFDLCERCAGFMGPVPAPSKHKLSHRIALNSISPPKQPALTKAGWITLAHYSVLADPDSEFKWYISILDALNISFPLERSMFPAQADPQIASKWQAFNSEEVRIAESLRSQTENHQKPDESQRLLEAQFRFMQVSTTSAALFGRR